MAKVDNKGPKPAASISFIYPPVMNPPPAMFRYFIAAGPYSPNGLYLRAQIRTTASSDRNAGAPWSLVKEHGAFDLVTATDYSTGYFTHPSGSGPPDPANEVFVHVWGYADSDDDEDEFVAHNYRSVKIVQLGPAAVEYFTLLLEEADTQDDPN